MVQQNVENERMLTRQGHSPGAPPDHRAPETGGARLRGALLVAAVAALLVLPPLGQRPITTSDEARFPLLARDMIERGAWFDVQVREKHYRNKPPLYPWGIAILSLPRGRVTEATAQLPVALAAIATVLFTFLIGDRLFDRRAGLWAALILATSYGFFEHSQKLLPDMLVVGFATVAGYAFCRAALGSSESGALVAFYAALAFGVFAKGPVGLLPLLAGAVWLWTEHGARGLSRLWSPVGVAVFAVVTASWVGPFLALGTRSFVKNVFWQNWLSWYLGLPMPWGVATAVVNALMDFMPWTLLAPLAFAYAARARRDPAVRFALVWFLVPLLAILLSENQRERYLLSIYPGAALLVAWWADAHGAVRTAAPRAVAWGSLAIVGAVLAVLAVPVGVTPPESRFAPGVSWEILPLVAGGALIALALFWGLRIGRPGLLIYGGVVAMVVILGYGTGLYNAWVQKTQDFPRLAAAIARSSPDGTPGVFGGRFFPIDFYLGRELHRIQTVEEFNEYLARPERPVVVVNGRTWKRIQGQISPDIRAIDRMWVRGQEMLIVRMGRPPGQPLRSTEPRARGRPWSREEAAR